LLWNIEKGLDEFTLHLRNLHIEYFYGYIVFVELLVPSIFAGNETDPAFKKLVGDLHQIDEVYEQRVCFVLGISNRSSGTCALDQLLDCVQTLGRKKSVSLYVPRAEDLLGHETTREPDADSNVLQLLICTSDPILRATAIASTLQDSLGPGNSSELSFSTELKKQYAKEVFLMQNSFYVVVILAVSYALYYTLI